MSGAGCEKKVGPPEAGRGAAFGASTPSAARSTQALTHHPVPGKQTTSVNKRETLNPKPYALNPKLP